jgi:hypothetical protein
LRPPTVTISTCDQPKAAAATTIRKSRPAMAYVPEALMPRGSAPVSSMPRRKERWLSAGFSRAIFTPRT